ncbi:hypothetical protein B0H13DRAFT_2345875 [Mycena leptocephala]|nr:hypothetical protein B0H13DRAFT_2345875 [Mycena leptocephala]
MRYLARYEILNSVLISREECVLSSVVRASLTLSRLLVSRIECVLEDEDGLFARKLELELATFGWETRLECSKHLLSTVVSDYFVYN